MMAVTSFIGAPTKTPCESGNVIAILRAYESRFSTNWLIQSAQRGAAKGPNAETAAFPAPRSASFHLPVTEAIPHQHGHIRSCRALTARAPALQPLIAVEEVFKRGQWQRVHDRTMMRRGEVRA
jgi:hypothetical protein